MADPQDQAELGQVGRARERRQPEAGQGHGDHNGFSWLTTLGFLFLTFNSGMAIYRSDRDVGSIAFVAGSYVDLVLLFICMRWFERRVDSPTRGQLKVAVWCLTTLLTVVFSYKVAEIIPFPVSVIIYAMAGAAARGFYAFFLHMDKAGAPAVNQEEGEGR